MAGYGHPYVIHAANLVITVWELPGLLMNTNFFQAQQAEPVRVAHEQQVRHHQQQQQQVRPQYVATNLEFLLKTPFTKMAVTPLFFNKFAIFLKILFPKTHIYV